MSELDRELAYGYAATSPIPSLAHYPCEFDWQPVPETFWDLWHPNKERIEPKALRSKRPKTPKATKYGSTAACRQGPRAQSDAAANPHQQEPSHEQRSPHRPKATRAVLKRWQEDGGDSMVISQAMVAVGVRNMGAPLSAATARPRLARALWTGEV
jgi:hypothetical protein